MKNRLNKIMQIMFFIAGFNSVCLIYNKTCMLVKGLSW